MFFFEPCDFIGIKNKNKKNFFVSLKYQNIKKNENQKIVFV